VIILLLGMLLIVWHAGGSAQAATLTVNTTVDTDDGVCDGQCSLREAIAVANPGDSIRIPTGTYTLDLGSQLVIDKDLTLTGQGAEKVTIQAATAAGVADFRVLSVIGAVVNISSVSFRYGNVSGEEDGGGIWNSGTLALATVKVGDNFAGDEGGGIWNSGTLTLTDSRVLDNTADDDGGGIYNFEGIVTLTNSRLNRNSSVDDGGGVRNQRGTLTVNSSEVNENFTGDDGGGIYNFEGTVTVTDTSVNNNIANDAGGIYNDDGGSTLTVTGSTINGNSVVRVGGGISNRDMMTLINSTVSNNSTDRYGGGVSNWATTIIINSTIYNNSAADQGGGITSPCGRRGCGPLELVNTIVAGNTAPSGPDCTISGLSTPGTITSLGYNLIGDSSGCDFVAAIGDLVGTAASPIDPMLGLLASNGGPTETHALLRGSPAIDAGDNTAAPATDQRGVARPQGSSADIGSFELEVSTVSELVVIKLAPDDPMEGSNIGRGVSISQDTIVAGAHKLEAAYVWRFDGTDWVQEAKLVASVPGIEVAPQFGKQVAIGGDTIAVGARYRVEGGIESGVVHIFRRSGTIWTEEAMLLANDPGQKDRFGISMGLTQDGNTLVVGASRNDDACPENPDCDSGSAYIFQRNGTTWTEEAKLIPSDLNELDRFGGQVRINGNTAVIGSRQSFVGDIRAGSVYVFERVGSTWTETAKLTASDGVEADLLGYHVAISEDENTIAASACCGFWDEPPLPPVDEERPGAIYIFQRDGGGWVEEAKLTPSDASAEVDTFGSFVAVTGDVVVVGRYWDQEEVVEGDDYRAGAAYIFERDGSSWSETVKLIASDIQRGGQFGRSAAIYGNTIALGANLTDGVFTDQGAVYVYDLVSDTPGDDPDISVSPTSLDFGQRVIGDFSVQTVTITNLGTQTLTVGDLTTTGVAFSVVSPEAPLDVAAGGTAEVTVRFSPITEGVDSGDLVITGNDPDQGLLTVPLTGEGISSAYQTERLFPNLTFVRTACRRPRFSFRHRAGRGYPNLPQPE